MYFFYLYYTSFNSELISCISYAPKNDPDNIYLCFIARGCAYACARVCARARARVRVRVCACARACARVCACARKRARVCSYARVRVREDFLCNS